MMRRSLIGRTLWVSLAAMSMAVLLTGCPVPGPSGNGNGNGNDNTNMNGNDNGTPAPSVINMAVISPEELAKLDVVSRVDAVMLGETSVVDFTVSTASGVGITGIGNEWDNSNRFVRFTLAKLVAGENGDPSQWVPYTRDTTDDGSTPPDYDTGGAFVDHGDGSYTFTFITNVEGVSGVSYESGLTHRLAGQIGSGDVALQPQNLLYDFVPTGGDVTQTRKIAVMDSCNECHDGLVFHGRRFIVEYCTNCHTAELAEGEGGMAYMIHKIHDAQKFSILNDGADFSEVTYPQDVTNCRKCHNGEDESTPDGDNWKMVPNQAACGSCHQISFTSPAPEGLEMHTGGAQADNSGCAMCHPASGGVAGIEDAHASGNPTPNNPMLPAGVPAMAFAISDVAVGASGAPTVTFAVMADGDLLDVTDLPDGFVDGDGAAFRWPIFLMAWAEAQDGINMPADYNNLGQSAGQPASVSLGDLVDAGGVTCSATECVADFNMTGNVFPAGATMRAIALQGYFRFDVDGDEATDANLHTLSAVKAVTGDEVRRAVIDNTKCANCHEWFEGHGGNRVIGVSVTGEVADQNVCLLCHVPNLSTSGRAIDPAAAADRDGDPATDDPSSATTALGTSDTWTWPEHTNNLKDMIHGIHASAARTTDYEFVRGRNDGIYYNWAEVTFPAEDGTRNCLVCHQPDTFQLPLADNVLPTTIRTTGTADGLDGNDFEAVGAARDGVPNGTDWVNSPTAATCYMCHDSAGAMAHMRQNGGIISVADPAASSFTTRDAFVPFESCDVCHGPGKTADLNLVHSLE